MKYIEATRWQEVPKSLWRWSNFSPAEMACKGTGRIKVSVAAMDALQALRDRLGKPIIITSAYRSPEHNKRVGGAKASKHMDGVAFDVRMDNHDPATFEAAARAVGFTSFGHYPRSGFMHIDTRETAVRWNVGGWFPARATDFAPEEAPKPLAQSRTMAGAGIAGAGIALAEAQTMLEPLIGHSDVVRNVFLIVAVAGIALTAYARWDDKRKGVR